MRAAAVPENSVVVPRFTNVTERSTLDPLSRGLALVLTTDLSRVRQLRVLERERMNVLLDEMALAAADTAAPGTPLRTAVDPSTAPRYGALLGARRFVQGSFVPVAETSIQLDAAVIDAKQGELTAAGQPLLGPLSDVLVLEKALCLHVLEQMGITPNAEERAAINLLPTTDYRAFLAFARGVGYEDQGEMGQAIAAYQEATTLDPKFDVARLRREVLEVTEADLEAADEAEARAAYGRELDPRDRLMRTGKWSWLVPDTDSATSSEEETVSGPNSVGDRNGAASIAITGSIPRR
ncbi:MAG: CsgG/HfaB family protein [Candidatus Eisenbacteria bacterium]